MVVDSRPFKSAVATCNGNKKVVGGGGWAFSVSATDEERLALTQLEPKDDVDGRGTDGYIASAAETAPGLNGNWWVQAYALCADASSVHGWRIVPKYTPTLSLPVQRIAAGCDNSRQRVLGTGARVESFVKGEVVLQVARSDGRGGIARAQAHEDADGYSGTWWLGAFAICADTPRGYEVPPFAPSPQRLSEATKEASVTCPGNKQLLSAGGAITNVAPGHVSLQMVFPSSILRPPRSVRVIAVENTPTSLNWDFIVAAAICAD